MECTKFSRLALALGVFLTSTGVAYSSASPAESTVMPEAAADNGTRETAARLVDIIDLEESARRSIQERIARHLEEEPGMGPYRSVLEEFFEKYLGYGSFKKNLAERLAERFSREELTAISRFYASEAGRKAREILPALISETSESLLQLAREHQEELRANIRQESLRIQKLLRDSSPQPQ